MPKMFEKYAADYARYRPGYPSGLIDNLVKSLKINNCSQILDLACGTGKLSDSLLKSCSPLIVGVDRSVVLLSQCNLSSKVNAFAEALPFRDNFFDAVVIAQAFHWFDFDKALKGIYRLLKPGGGFAIVWYRRQRPLQGHRLKMDQLLKAINPNHKIVFMDYDWPEIIGKHGGFSRGRKFETVQAWDYPKEDYLKLQRSKSYIGDTLAKEQLEEFMKDYADILDDEYPEGIIREKLEYFYVSANKI